jgi:hypothetical protein
MEHKILWRHPLGNPERSWKQDNFILSTFSAKGEDMRKIIRNCAEAGFNLLEIGWASHEQANEAVSLCEQLGIDLLFQDFSRFGGMQGFLDDKCKNDLETVIRELSKWRRVVGFYVWDEPLLDDQLKASRNLVDIVEKEAPDRLPFTVAIPSYNTDYTWSNGLFPAYLERYVNIINPPILSLDYYPFGVPGDQDEVNQCDNSRMWCDLGLMKKLGEKYDMPIWFYYQGLNHHNVDFFIFPMIRMMMYGGALYGSKALQHFTVVGSVIDEYGNKEKFFEDQKEIHADFKNLGDTLMALNCKRVIHDETVKPNCDMFDELHSKEADSAYLSDKLPARVSVSEFEDNYGNGYMMVLNRDYMTEQSVSLALNGNYRIYEVSKSDGLQYVVSDSAEKLDIKLAAGDAVLLRLQKSDEEPYTIEYRLTK